MKKIEIKNKMYQPFKLLANGSIELIEAKEKRTVKMASVTDQIITAAERGFISYKVIE